MKNITVCRYLDHGRNSVFPYTDLYLIGLDRASHMETEASFFAKSAMMFYVFR